MDFVLALHSHLPYVLNHGRWPHGSDWICEADIETYLPLLETLHALDAGNVAAPVDREMDRLTDCDVDRVEVGRGEHAGSFGQLDEKDGVGGTRVPFWIEAAVAHCERADRACAFHRPER